jgi:hypothetical protein
MLANRRFAALFKLCRGFLLLAIVLSLLGLVPGVAQASAPNPQPNPPQLLAPADRVNLATLTPKFSWTAVPGADHYELTITPMSGSTISITTFTPSYIATIADGLAYGVTYSWQVTVPLMNDPSTPAPDLSMVRTFTINILKSPTNGAYVTTQNPTFTWLAVPGATQYDIYYRRNNPVIDPSTDTPQYSGKLTKYTAPF